MNSVFRQRHPDDRFFDAFDVRTVERWKSSGLSGSQWRFAVEVELKRKGRVMFRQSFGSFTYAAAAAAAAIQLSPVELDMSKEWEKVTDDNPDLEVGMCCQPGCSERSVVWLRMKQEFNKSCSLSRKLGKDEFWYREFCKKHKNRGDQGLDDGPTNYIKLSEPPEAKRDANAGCSN